MRILPDKPPENKLTLDPTTIADGTHAMAAGYKFFSKHIENLPAVEQNTVSIY